LKEVNIPTGESQKVTFIVNKEMPGNYKVEINGQISFFNVEKGNRQSIDWSLPFYNWIFVGVVFLVLITAVGIWWWRRNSYY
jgi:hypothetical protein